MSFEKVADELYGLSLAEFVSARDARAAAARQQKDRSLATALKGLAKPTVGAWAVNQLVRRSRPLVERLLLVGDGLRQAQMRLDGDRLRELSAERRRLMAEVNEELRALDLSDAAEQEAAETLGAAVAEAAAAAEVRAGRLTRGLQHSGFGGMEGMLATGFPVASVVPEPAEPDPKTEAEPEPKPDPEPEPVELEVEPPPLPGPKPKPAPADKLLKRRLESALEALEEALSDRDVARERLDSVRQRLQTAKDKLKAAEEAVREAEAERDHLQEQLDEL